jgi:hypothetical protein
MGGGGARRRFVMNAGISGRDREELRIRFGAKSALPLVPWVDCELCVFCEYVAEGVWECPDCEYVWWFEVE